MVNGRFHSVQRLDFSDKPVNDERYRKFGSVYIDSDLKHVGKGFLSEYSGPRFITVAGDARISGQSWEYAASGEVKTSRDRPATGVWSQSGYRPPDHVTAKKLGVRNVQVPRG